MTTGIDHTIAPWGYSASGGSAQVNGQQGAYRTGRKYPYVPSIASSATSVRPYVVPWLATSDAFGVSFPAGIVGVTTVVQTGSSLSGNLNADYESQWGDLTKGTGIIPVPSVLPADYTANLDTPWTYSGFPLTYLRSASGFTNQTWAPTGSPNGITDTISVTDGDYRSVFDGTNYIHQVPIAVEGTGCRSLRIKNNFTPAAGATPSCTISHNNNTGTRPTGTDAGDTIDQSFTMPADLSYLTLGSLTAKTGVSTVFVLRMIVDPAHLGISGVWTVDISPRVDVPYVVTLSGQGDLIAPGGYPT